MTDLTTIAAGGNYLATLKALRDRVAVLIDATDSGRDIAALSNRLLQTLKAIAEVEAEPARERRTPIDEVHERRAARESAAKGNLNK